MSVYTKSGKLLTKGGKAVACIDDCDCGECVCAICLAGDIPTTATVTISGVAKKTSPDCDCLQFNGTFVISLSRAAPTLLVPCPPYQGEQAFTIPACGSRPTANIKLVVRVIPFNNDGGADCFSEAQVVTTFQTSGGASFEGVESGTGGTNAATCKGGAYGTLSRTPNGSSLYCNWGSSTSSVTIT